MMTKACSVQNIFIYLFIVEKKESSVLWDKPDRP